MLLLMTKRSILTAKSDRFAPASPFPYLSFRLLKDEKNS